MEIEQDLHEPNYFKKRRLWKKLLEERGIEIDCEQALGDFILRMDLLLHAKQYADAHEGFHCNKEITTEELKNFIEEE